MKTNYSRIIALILIVSTFFYTCRHELIKPEENGTGNNPPPQTNSCSPDSVYFVNEIQPIISSNCTTSGCHDDITHAEGVNLTTYSRILRYVKPGNATGSKLYEVIFKSGGERMPPPPMPALTTDQKNKIIKWINQGALNNSCAGFCDSMVFTFSGAIKNLLQAKCTGCHNPSSLGGNIDLSTYAAVKTQADNGKLYGSVTHKTGYAPMPKNSAKLSDCEIRQIQKWIQAGTLNN